MHVINVLHRTTFLYREFVQLGEHRLMSRPRDSHDLRLLDTSLALRPSAASLRWIHDVFGNSIALATFDEPTQELVIESGFRAEHYPAERHALWDLEPYAARLPFSYAAEDALDLGHSKERHYPDPGHEVDTWVKGIVDQVPHARTLDVLEAINTGIKAQLRYKAREAPGVQSPLETLQLGTGSCRDFAVLMMEGVRSLGLAARFVSGYLYDEALMGARGGVVGGGSTHAWASVYLPGAGWVELDPTHATMGGHNLIRVAVARDASQAAPLVGSYRGAPGALIRMTVDVQVTAE
jgi:transglutaminase-like putative cysteine protease